jgi:hypothetical protein
MIDNIDNFETGEHRELTDQAVSMCLGSGLAPAAG